jgi:hypothetical protein
MARLFSWMMTTVALVVVIVTLVLLALPEREETRPSEGDVTTRIRNLQTIATTEFRYRDVVYFGEQSRFLGIPAGSRRILFSVTISVIAGLDLNRGIDVQIAQENPDRVFVTLPSPEVIRVDAEERSLKQYFVQERFGRLDWLAVSDQVELAKERNRIDAIERGLLLQAEEQARAVIVRLLRTAGFSSVNVRFRPREGALTG